MDHVTMEQGTTESRCREAFATLHLQRAADQLQDAIRSARKRRSSSSLSRDTAELSLLDLSSSLSSVEEDDDDDGDNHMDETAGSSAANKKPVAVSEDSDQENQPQRGNAVSVREEMYSWSVRGLGSTEASLRRRISEAKSTHQDTTEDTTEYTSMHVHDLQRSFAKYQDHEGLGTLLLGEQQQTGGAVRNPEPVAGQVPRRLFQDTTVERETRRALQHLQRDVEDQARKNMAVQNHLGLVIRQVNSFVQSICRDSERTGEHLSMENDGLSEERWPLDRVVELTDKWELVLLEWRDGVTMKQRELAKKIEQVGETDDAKMNELLVDHRETTDGYAKVLSERTEEIERLKMTIADVEVKTMDTVALERIRALRQIATEQMQTEDLRSQISRVEGYSSPSDDSISREDDLPSSVAEQHQRHVLNLIAQLKQSELCELKWEMTYEQQLLDTLQLEERLGMLLEDGLHVSADPSHHCNAVANVSTTTNENLLKYNRQIEQLESHLQDTQQQVQCDHEQFIYEQKKWELEKKHWGNDVDEIHDVSVKVLKLLLIREKLLKRQERRLESRRERVRQSETALQLLQDALRQTIEGVMQECAVGLLYLQQLAMQPTNHRDLPSSSSPLPIKPLRLTRLLKRLRKLQDQVQQGPPPLSPAGSSAPSSSSDTSATSTGATAPFV